MNKKYCAVLLALAIVVCAAGACSKSGPASEAGAKLPGTESSALQPKTAANAPLPDSLVGTTWIVGEYTAAFQTAQDVLVKGGPIPDPQGAKGTYKLQPDKGLIELTVLNTTKSGTWDGTRLVVDGSIGVKQQ